MAPSLQKNMRTLLEYPSTERRKVPFGAYCTQAQQPIQVIKKNDLSSNTLTLSRGVMEYCLLHQHICNLYLAPRESVLTPLDVSNRHYYLQPSLLICTLSPNLRTAFFRFPPIRLEGLLWNEGHQDDQKKSPTSLKYLSFSAGLQSKLPTTYS